MILATGNRVILLGTVRDQRTKSGAENIAKQAASGANIDNRLHVNAQARRLPDAELEKDTSDILGGGLGDRVQVQAQNGRVTLQGQLDTWRQVADAIDAAFKTGATQVNSQFSVAGAIAQGSGQGYGGAQANRYAPSQQGPYGGQ
jgi:osmotically-inducible protein OsmY